MFLAMGAASVVFGVVGVVGDSAAGEPVAAADAPRNRPRNRPRFGVSHAATKRRRGSEDDDDDDDDAGVNRAVHGARDDANDILAHSLGSRGRQCPAPCPTSG